MAKPIPTTSVGAALQVWGEHVELLEQIYDSQAGEVDEGSEAAEWFAELAAAEALEALARFERFLQNALCSIDDERQRLASAQDRVDRRLAWCHGKILEILDSQGVRSKAAGPFRISTRQGSERVVANPGLDLDSLPAEVVRVKPPVAERRELDKKAAKSWLKSDDKMPIPGLSLERGPTTVKVD